MLNHSISEMIVVFCTTPVGKAGELAQKLVENCLAACVNVVQNVKSTYYWEGKIENDSEDLMIIKTKRELFNDLEKFIKSNHPYTVPEIVALDVVSVSDNYLKWLMDYLT